MSYAEAGAVVASLRDGVRSPEWAESLPIGVEVAYEAQGEERCGASSAGMRAEIGYHGRGCYGQEGG